MVAIAVAAEPAGGSKQPRSGWLAHRTGPSDRLIGHLVVGIGRIVEVQADGSTRSSSSSGSTPIGCTRMPRGSSVHASPSGRSVQGDASIGAARTMASPLRDEIDRVTRRVNSAACSAAMMTTAGSHISPLVCRARNENVVRCRLRRRADQRGGQFDRLVDRGHDLRVSMAEEGVLVDAHTDEMGDLGELGAGQPDGERTSDRRRRSRGRRRSPACRSPRSRRAHPTRRCRRRAASAPHTVRRRLGRSPRGRRRARHRHRPTGAGADPRSRQFGGCAEVKLDGAVGTRTERRRHAGRRWRAQQQRRAGRCRCAGAVRWRRGGAACVPCCRIRPSGAECAPAPRRHAAGARRRAARRATMPVAISAACPSPIGDDGKPLSSSPSASAGGAGAGGGNVDVVVVVVVVDRDVWSARRRRRRAVDSSSTRRERRLAGEHRRWPAAPDRSMTARPRGRRRRRGGSSAGRRRRGAGC